MLYQGWAHIGSLNMLHYPDMERTGNRDKREGMYIACLFIFKEMTMDINADAYYVVQYWMIKAGLKGLKLQLFAIINGFSQNSQGYFYGSLDYLALFTGYEKTRINRALNELVADGFLIKKTRGKKCEFRIHNNMDKLTKRQPQVDKMSTNKLTKRQDNVDKMSNNNIDNNINLKNNIYVDRLQGNLSERKNDFCKEKEKKNSAENPLKGVFTAYCAFLFRNTKTVTKIRFESDYVQKALTKIYKAYKDLKPDMSLFNFAYAVIVGNYVRLEFKAGQRDSHLRTSIETIARHCESNFDFYLQEKISIKPEEALKLWMEHRDGISNNRE